LIQPAPGVSLMLHTIEFTQSVGFFTSAMTSSAIILFSADLYKGSICIGTVRGGCTTGTGLSTN
jgi:hypothetical protein